MYASPKAGLAQKKKRQAIRRLSQTGKKISPLSSGASHTASRGRGTRVTRGQSSSFTRTRFSQSNSQSFEDNPFLKGLPSAKPPKSQEMAQSQLDNPFLSGLVQRKQPKQVELDRPPPPNYETFLGTQDMSSNEPNTVQQPTASVQSFPVPGHASTEQQSNPFLATSSFKSSNTENIPVYTSQREDKGGPGLKVSFHPSTGVDSKPNIRVPSYSEVASLRAQPQRAIGGIGRTTVPPQYANLKTLHVKGIPDELNNSDVLRNHFSQFGQVKLLKCFPAKKFATVEYVTRQDAVKAKKAGKVVSPNHDPVMIFWHASRAPTPATTTVLTQGSKFVNPAEQFGSRDVQVRNGDPRLKKPAPPQDDSVEEVPLQQSIKISKEGKQHRKPSVWSRLGPEKESQKDDENWTPDEAVADEGDDDVDEGVDEGRDFLRELGNKVTGDEMDTIAKTVDHPYFLRSLMQSETHDGPSTSSQPLNVTQPGQMDSRQLYSIPSPNVPLLPPPRGITASDYYEALDVRDQEIRKGMVKQTVLSKARATVGTCPDMCPEKERYRREDTRRLSWFEVRTDSSSGKPKVDHTKAIKEYSGSAADKEEPLPHELRPLSVLKMTMDYLVTRVMDDYQERPADWYDFVWNRTRGIRKDITLQHLCTVESTGLTEKCARFHILCSHLLCEEDTMTFDPKMNNENLNKCLLSLKEFYRDLRTEKGILCPNEAEFCCYDLLLHLTEGNVLNLVSQYSETVRDTPEVRFAVDVALSLDSNNFVKFFKLIKVATYLNACILHRYFDFVRTRALAVMNRAHTSVKRPTNFPLSDLCRMLAFENNEMAAQFCEFKFNLTVPHPRTTVQFVRGAAVNEGEQTVPVQRSPYLVDRKNHKPLGEVVNGGPLPHRFSHTPFSSFSSESQLLQTTMPLPVQAPLSPPTKPAYNEEDLVSAVELVTGEAVGVSVEEVIRECLHEEEQLVNEVKSLVCASILDSFLADMVRSECQELSQKSLLEALEIKEIKDDLADSEVLMTIETVLRLEVLETVQSIYWDCVLTAQATDAVVTCMTEELVEECLCEGVRDVVSETVCQLKQERKEKLEVIRQQCLRQRTHKYWQRWCQALRVREHVRQCASDIPPLPPLVSLPWQLDVLCPLEKRRRVEVTSSLETAEQLEDSNKEREKRRQEFFAPLDMPSVLQDTLLAFHTPSPASHPHTPHIHWKLTFIYPPQDRLSSSDTHNLNWLYRKLQFNTPKRNSSVQHVPVQGSEQLSISSTPVHGTSMWDGQGQRRLNIVVQGLCSVLRDSVSGSSGVMMYAPLPRGESTEEYVSQVFEMLKIVTRSCKSSSGIPLLLVCSRQLEDKHLAAWFSMRRALDEYCKRPSSCLSAVNCLKLDIPNYMPMSPIDEEQLVCSSLQWLAEHSRPPPTLCHTPVKDFLEQGLLELFVPLVVTDSTARDKACLPSQPLAPLISLYNYVLDHLATVATGDELVTLDWPVPEFAPQKFSYGGLPPEYWNSPSYLTELQQCIVSLQLPPASHLDPNWTEHDWHSQYAQCLDYVTTIQLHGLGYQGGTVTLLSRVKALLHQHRQLFESGNINQSECSVPWAQVILACIEHLLSCLDSDLWASCLNNNTKQKFTMPRSWLRAQAETSLCTAAQLTNPRSPHRRKHRRHKSDPPHLTSTPLTSSTHFPSASSTPKPVSLTVSSSMGVSPDSAAVRETNVPVNTLREKLKLVQREKASSQRFEAQLTQWMNSSPSPNVTLTEHDKPISASVFKGVKALSLAEKLEELQSQIRAAKWKEKENNVYLRAVSKTNLH